MVRLGMAALAFLCLIETSSARAEDQTRPLLDHAKPWFTRAGAPICATKEDLATLRENASLEFSHSLKERKPANCFAARDGIAVVEVDKDGSFDPDYQVRLPTRALAWVPNRGLRN
jgi:hypothetical protein